MTEEEWEQSVPTSAMQRLADAMIEVSTALSVTSTPFPMLQQMSDLVTLWCALPTHESRERALSAIRAVSDRHRH